MLFVLLALVGAREAFGTVVGGALAPAPSRSRSGGSSTSSRGTRSARAPPSRPRRTSCRWRCSASLVGPTRHDQRAARARRPALVLGRVALPARRRPAARRRRARPAWLLFLGAATYALVSAASGAWGLGRFGVVVVAVLLPWLAHAALGFADPEPRPPLARRRGGPACCSRWRRLRAAGLLVRLVLAVLVVGAGFWISARAMRDRSVVGSAGGGAAGLPGAAARALVGARAAHGAAAALALDAGRLPMATVGFERPRDRPPRRRRRPGVARPAAARRRRARAGARRYPDPGAGLLDRGAGGGAGRAGAGLLTFERDAVATKAGLGFLVVVIQAAFVVGAVIAAQGASARRLRRAWRRRRSRSRSSRSPRSCRWSGSAGSSSTGPGELEDTADTGIPAYMMQSAALGPSHGILVVEGDVETGFTWSVLREDGLTVGEDEIVGLMAVRRRARRATCRRWSPRPASGRGRALPGHGIEYVVLPRPPTATSPPVLDATTGLEQASAENRRPAPGGRRAGRARTPSAAGVVAADRAGGRCRASRSSSSWCCARRARDGSAR